MTLGDLRASPPQPRDIDVRGLSLRLWDHGGEGPLALFLHGYLDTGRSFDAVAAHLRGRARVLCLDWRGHGGSDQVGKGGSYHLLDHLKDLDGVVEHLQREGTPPDALIAHSMGGNVGLLFAGAVPERAARLLLVDALGAPAEAPEDQPQRLADALEAARSLRPFSPFQTLEEAMARLRAMNPGLSELGARRMAEPVLARGDDGALRFPFDARLKGPTPVRWPEAMWLSLCARVTARVHVLRCEHGYLPDDDTVARRLAALGAEVQLVENAPHHVHVERPDAVAEATLRLLEQPLR